MKFFFIFISLLFLYLPLILGQNPYYNKVVKWNVNQNGNEIKQLNETHSHITGSYLDSISLLWSAFLVEIENETGELTNLIDLTDSLGESRSDRILHKEGKTAIFGFGESNISPMSGKFWLLGENYNIESYTNIGNYVRFFGACPSQDTGYLVGGYIIPEADKELYLAKLDSVGNLEWEKILDSYWGHNSFSEIIQSPDGGYYCIGAVNSNDGYTGDALLMKINNVGDVEWSQLYNGLQYTGGIDVEKDQNGDLIMNLLGLQNLTVGYSYIVKVDTLGNILWDYNFYDTQESARFVSVKIGIDNSYYFAGTEQKNSYNEITIAKFSPDGELLWRRNYGGEGDDDYCYDMMIDDKGALMLTGRVESSTPVGADVLIMRTNCMGLFTYPEASFDYQLNENEVIFENLSEFVYVDSIDGGHYLWDFGDGSTSTEINPTHIYEEAAAYEVQLTAIVCQDTAVYSQCVYLSEEVLCCPALTDYPIAAFSTFYEEDSLTVFFANESINLYSEYINGASVYWDFGDGQSSTALNVSHQYTETGLYEVNLSIILCNDTTYTSNTILVGDTTDTALQSLSLPSLIEVSPNPVQDYVIFQFTDLSKQSILRFYNSVGQEVKRVEIAAFSQAKRIELNQLASGIYFWKLREESGKLLKQ